MKTIFQLGLPHNNMVWMGQAATDQTRRVDVDELCGKLNPAMDTWNQVNDFIKRPNYRQLLGDQASLFDDLKAKADSVSEAAIYVQGTICLGGAGSITSSDNDNSRYFAGIMNSMGPIVQNAVAKAAVTPTVPKPGTAAKPVAAAPAPSGGLSPLAIGGLTAAGLVAIALVVS